MGILRLVRAEEPDLAYIMATERLDGYDDVVGRWNESEHRAALADGRHAYFLGYVDLEPIGFVIVRDWAASERVSSVKRIAVSNPGQGHGRQLMRAVVATVFQETNAHRLWLDVFPENLRARRAYEAVGFVVEGIAKGSAFFRNIHRDLLIMAILRTEWQEIDHNKQLHNLPEAPGGGG